MADDIRDEGRLNSQTRASTIIQYKNPSQIYSVTHDGAGNRLPHRKLSFLDFSFGGKWIDEFNLMAYCKDSTMNRSGSAPFSDLTSSYDIMDGQYYHGTHYEPFKLSLDLISDGIDEQVLQNFLYWFAGGKTRELVLAEHPNRAIMARVSETPELQVLPFEQKINITMGGLEYTTSTTLYKGTISLNFIADEPFWYSKQNILFYNSTANQGIFAGKSLIDTSSLFPEAIKIVYEDNVPFNSMVRTTMHFGEDKYAAVGTDVQYSKIARKYADERPSDWDTLKLQPGYFELPVGNQVEYWVGACIEASNSTSILGRIAGATILDESTSVTGAIPSNSYAYQLFYGGTAPSPTIVSFNIDITHDSNNYINCIANSNYKVSSKDYSTITVESVHKKTFDFTLPNIMASWNKAYKLFNSISTSTSTGTNWKDLSETIRDQIRHPAVRTFAVQIINYIQTNNESQNYIWLNNTTGIFLAAGKTLCITLLNRFFQRYDYSTQTWQNESSASFIFDADQCTVTGTFTYWKETTSNGNIISFIQDISNKSANQIKARYTTHTEDVGDMMRSNWLFLEDRNLLIDNQYINAWSSSSKTNAHRVYHNAPQPINDLKIKYKNMYL